MQILLVNAFLGRKACHELIVSNFFLPAIKSESAAKLKIPCNGKVLGDHLNSLILLDY